MIAKLTFTPGALRRLGSRAKHLLSETDLATAPILSILTMKGTRDMMFGLPECVLTQAPHVNFLVYAGVSLVDEPLSAS